MTTLLANLGAIARRSEARELLELPAVTAREVRESLADMERYNRLLGGRRFLKRHVFPLIERHRGPRPLRLLDVGCGGAGMTRAAVEFARRRGVRVRAIGLDIDGRSLEFAREQTSGYGEIVLVRADSAALPFRAESIDIAFSTLFFHHLTPSAGVRSLRRLRAVCKGPILMNDLARNRLAALAFRLTAPLMAASDFTKHDGLISIYRSYNAAELRDLFRQAGCRDVRIARDPLFFRMTTIDRGVVS